MTPGIPGLICPKCSVMHSAPVQQEFIDYFEGRDWICKYCQHREVLWDLLYIWVRNRNPLVPGILALGIGRQLVISEQMHPDRTIQVFFEKHGIPEEATVIDVVLTPIGLSESGPNLWPALRTQHVRLNRVDHHLFIHPVEIPEVRGVDSNDPNVNQVNILVIWVPPASEPEEEPLYSAATSFTAGDFRGSIIPAQVAVELKLSRILTQHYSHFGSKNDVTSFLNSGATYGHQLRFLMPSLFKLIGAPPLPEAVRSGLRSLQTCRNKVGHQHFEVSREEAAGMLLAAKFGYEYLKICGPLLASA